jgi:hypothetical protein
MTAKTAQSHVVGGMSVNGPADARTSWIWGKTAAGSYVVGNVVYQSAAGVWTIQASNAGHLQRTGVIGFNPRVSITDFARKDIDDTYDSGENVPICTSGIVIAKVTDNNSGVGKDVHYILGTAGEFTINTDATYFPRARCVVAQIDNDVYALVGIGLYLWVGE